VDKELGRLVWGWREPEIAALREENDALKAKMCVLAAEVDGVRAERDALTKPAPCGVVGHRACDWVSDQPEGSRMFRGDGVEEFAGHCVRCAELATAREESAQAERQRTLIEASRIRCCWCRDGDIPSQRFENSSDFYHGDFYCHATPEHHIRISEVHSASALDEALRRARLEEANVPHLSANSPEPVAHLCQGALLRPYPALLCSLCIPSSPSRDLTFLQVCDLAGALDDLPKIIEWAVEWTMKQTCHREDCPVSWDAGFPSSKAGALIAYKARLAALKEGK
jgi:hypothetical protein